MSYRLANSNFLTPDERKIVESATGVMPVVARLLDKELRAVEAKLDSETNFELPAYNERMIDLIAQRRTLRKLKHYFELIED